MESELTRRDVLLNGLEVHKFIPFVTFSQRVQVGLNVGGGFGFMSGHVDAVEFQTSYTCTFPPGVFPDFGAGGDEPPNPCSNATITNVTTVQTGSSSDDVSRILKSDSDLMPIGRVEVAAAFIAGPRLKIRVAGGLNYPGCQRGLDHRRVLFRRELTDEIVGAVSSSEQSSVHVRPYRAKPRHR